MTNKKGFTLIELLVVVAIIGLLSSIVLVGLGSFRGRARDARRLADLRQTQNSLELYYSANNNYPSATDWTTLTSALIAAPIGVKNVSNDPLPPPATYYYGVSTDHQNYILGASLEDASNPALTDDYSGSITGYTGNLVPCTASVYCLAF